MPATKRTLRDLLDIVGPRALPGAIPMAILCPTFGFGIFFTGLCGTTFGFEHAGLFYTISAISMVAIRLASKSFMDTVPVIKTYAVAVACALVEVWHAFGCSHGGGAVVLCIRHHLWLGAGNRYARYQKRCHQEHAFGVLGRIKRSLPLDERSWHRGFQLAPGSLQ